MYRAYDESAPSGGGEWSDGCGFAAEIRALADWLVPEEPPLQGDEADCAVTWGKWHQRQQLRGRLLSQAKTAEAGE